MLIPNPLYDFHTCLSPSKILTIRPNKTLAELTLHSITNQQLPDIIPRTPHDILHTPSPSTQPRQRIVEWPHQMVSTKIKQDLPRPLLTQPVRKSADWRTGNMDPASIWMCREVLETTGMSGGWDCRVGIDGVLAGTEIRSGSVEGLETFSSSCSGKTSPQWPSPR
jgi:hypothetical protein